MVENKYTFPKDAHSQLQWMMIVAHETMKSGFNSIYGHLENPPMNDLPNFLTYCSVWTRMVEKHHGIEEKFMFPDLQKKVDFSHELEQHKHIHEGVHKVIDFLREAKEDHTKFDPAKLRNMMAGFRDVLFAHLDEEVQDLAPDRLKDFSKEEIQEISDRLDAAAKAEGGLTDLMPFAFGNMPLEYKPYFPPFLPKLIRHFLLPYVIFPYNRSWLKYCPNKP